MKNTIITFTLLGIIILLIIYLFFILMTMPVWVLLLIIGISKYSEIKEFVKSL